MERHFAYWLVAISHILAVHQNLLELHRKAEKYRTDIDCFFSFFLSSSHPPFSHKLFPHWVFHVLALITFSFPPFQFPTLFFLPSRPFSVLFLSSTAYLSSFFFFFTFALVLMLSFFHPFLPAPKFLQPSPDSLHTSVLAFITVGCTDKRISLLRLHQSCHVRSVKISGGGLGRRKCLKVSHKTVSYIKTGWYEMERETVSARCPWVCSQTVQLNVTTAAV